LSNIKDFPPQIIQLFKDETLDLLGQWENACIALQQKPVKSDWDQLFAAVHSIKGSVQTLGLHHFSDYLALIETFLATDSAQTIHSTQLQALLKGQSSAVDWVQNIESLDDSSILSDIESLEPVLNNKGENTNEGSVVESLSNTENSNSTLAIDTPETNISDTPRQDLNDDVRISGKIVDKILDQLNEIKTHQAIMENYFLSGDANRDLAIQSLTISQSRIRDLRRHVSHLRAVNAEVVFKRIVRTVTEANLALGKNVQINFEGHLVKLDKSLADQIVSPLIHLVRNCVDHGIESSTVRTGLGKNENGQINIRIQRRVRVIEITVEDDGAGIDTEKLMQKAVTTGVIKKQPSEITDQIVLQILCSPGFSTSQSVTSISGRGVGMNAVAEKIYSLGGQLSLTHETNVGTAFSIVVPNSITSIKAIVVTINHYKLAIPMNEIVEVYQFNKTELDTAFGEAKLEFKDDIIKFISLADIFHATDNDSPQNEEIFGLISGNGLSKTAYGVHSIVGQQEVVVRPLEAKLTGMPGCQGAAYFSDGTPGLVLSLNTLRQTTSPEVVH